MSGLTRKLHTVITGILAMLMSASCSDNGSSTVSGTGTMTVSLDAAYTLSLPLGAPAPEECPPLADESEISLTMQDLSGNYAHTWEHFSDFTQNISYFSGQYLIEATGGSPYEEGFDNPAFAGSSTATVTDGERTDVVVELKPASAFVRVGFDKSSVEYFGEIRALIHTPGGKYHTFAPDETRILCTRPADTEIYITFTTTDGHRRQYLAATLPSTKAATLYNVDITLDTDGSQTPVLGVTTYLGLQSTELTTAFLDAMPPVITLEGASGATALTLPEGDTPSAPVIATVATSGTPLRSLILTTRSASLAADSMPIQVDLLAPTADETGILSRLGLKTSLSASAGGTVDFTGLLAELVYLTPDRASSTFTLLACDATGTVTLPTTFEVITTPVDIEIISSSPAIMGVDKAVVTIRCPAPGFADHVETEIETHTGVWEKTPLTVTAAGEGIYDISFTIPEGSAPVNARILYCDEVRSTLSIRREMPAFDIAVDTYAKSAAIRIDHADPALVRMITERVSIYVDDEAVPVYHHMPDSGIVTVIGLAPSTTYSFKATMMESGTPGISFTSAVKATTESVRQLTNADFEERTDGPRYKDMPSGGLYAKTVVDIFNWQHHTTYSCEVPKGWATVNEKTFNNDARNHNTWYMQPSTYLVRDDAASGSFSALLTSVAFDTDGAPIPPYSQQQQPYLDYSPIVPEITCRAAGRLFLGSYSFNPATLEETYREGTSWSTRPLSLNGYYKFVPGLRARDDRGYASIEIIGEDAQGTETTLASGTLLLPLATSFTAFSIPLTYDHFGIRATRIKVMFASSANIGSLAEETASVVTTPDPVTATSTGGRLWIDCLTLAY